MKNMLLCSLILFAISNFAKAESSCDNLLNSACRNFESNFIARARLAKVENNVNDVDGDLDKINSVKVRLGMSLDATVDSFIYTLQKVGNSNSRAAQEIFIELSYYVSGEYQLQEILNVFFEIRELSQSPQDAYDNFDVIHKAAILCGPLSVAKANFIRVYNQVGGHGNDKQARTVFSDLYQLYMLNYKRITN